MARQDIFAACRSGVAQISLECAGDTLTAGTGFLVPGGLVTNSHVLREVVFDVAVIRFDDMDYASGIRLAQDVCLGAIAYESPCNEHDVAFVRLDEPELANRHLFTFGDSASVRVGDEIGFLGYPFQMRQLTCHMGHVSSLHRSGLVDVIQVDASVNGGNSGGPLIDLSNGEVLGIISRAEVGFLADQLDQLIKVLTLNIRLLERPTGAQVVIAGLDPVQAVKSSQTALREVAVHLRRSANVGIGYAFSSNHIRDQVGLSC